MACLIQLRRPSYTLTAPGHQPEPSSPSPIDRSLLKSKIQLLFKDFYPPPLIRFIGPHSQNFQVHFLVPFLQNFELLFQFQLSVSGQLRKIKFKLRKEGRLTLVTFSQAIRSFCRTITKFNNAPTSLPFTFGIDLKNGEIGGKAALKGITLSNKLLVVLTKRLVSEAQNTMQSFVSQFLYNYTRQGINFVKSHGSQDINQSIFGKQGQLRSYQRIKELIPFLNSDLEGKGETGPKGRKFFPPLENALKVMELNSNQHNKVLKENILFASCDYQQEDGQNTMEFNKDAMKNQLFFPTPPKISEACQLRSINIISQLKERENVLKAGPKAKVSIMQLKFKEVSIRPSENTDVKPREQILVVKQSARKNDIAKEMAIRYEKQIIQQLSVAYCHYLPTYYKPIQTNVAHKDLILMEFINAYTVHQVIQAKRYFLGMPSKLKLLVHISNVLRFLDHRQVVHVDLSPNNLLVVEDLSIRLIDFGQAYCPKVTSKYMNPEKLGKNDGGFRYRPCKTFPYSSPEAYCRSSNFSSNQDMYSFGMIAFKALFGYNLMTCSQKTLEKTYRSKQYMQRMFFVPETLSDNANNEILTILAYIIFRLLDDEKCRPSVAWVHLITKRLFHLANR